MKKTIYALMLAMLGWLALAPSASPAATHSFGMNMTAAIRQTVQIPVAQQWLPDKTSFDIGTESDSLGGDSLHGTPFLKLAKLIAAKLPNTTVNEYYWADSLNAPPQDNAFHLSYSRPGTNGYTINIWNAYVGTTVPQYLMGAKFAAAIGANNPRFYIWQHGKNVASSQSPEGDFLAPAEMIRLAKPGVPHLYIMELPNRDDNAMAVINEGAIPLLVSRYGDIPTVDSYSLERARKAAGWDATPWHDDNLHPDDLGVNTYLMAPLWKLLTTTPMPTAVTPANLATKGSNMIPNGDFSAWSGALPDGFTSPGSYVTAAKETTIKDAGTPYSAKLTGTTAGSQLRYVFTAAQLSALAPSLTGKRLLLATRINTSTSTSVTAGYIALSWNDDAGTHTFNKSTNAVGPKGAFAWFFDYPPLAITGTITSLNIQLGVDTLANSGPAASTVYYQRAILTAGGQLNDMAFATQ